jgi:hypothetical protein
MLASRITLVVALTALVPVPAAADSILYTTFGPGRTFDNLSGTFFGFEAGEEDSPDSRFARAMPFTPRKTGTLGAIALAIQSPLFEPGPGSIVINLFAADGDLPGRLIESFMRTEPVDLGVAEFQSVLNPLIQAGETYYLEATTSGVYNGTWFGSPDPVFGNVRDVYRVNNGPWRVSVRDFAAAFEISGDLNASPVPEPASLLLVGAGLAAAALRRRKSLTTGTPD